MPAQCARITGFPPIEGPGCRVLVLGTCPSAASLAAGRYYAHPRNAFWPIMEHLFAGGASLPYDERVLLLVNNGIALWDVLHSAVRTTSLDADIVRESEVPNDIGGLIARHPGIRTVFFNGITAARLYRRHVASRVIDRDMRYVTLPSTSPAHASRTFEEKLAAWTAVQRAAHGA